MTRERQVAAVSGWVMVPVLLAGLLGSLFGPDHRRTNPHAVLGHRRSHRAGHLRLPAHRPVRRQPERGQGAAAVREIRRHARSAGPALREPALSQAPHLAARPQLRERQAEGQRPRRQSDRDCRRRRLEGRRHGRGRVRGGRLRELRPRAERVGAAQHGDQLPVRRARRRR